MKSHLFTILLLCEGIKSGDRVMQCLLGFCSDAPYIHFCPHAIQRGGGDIMLLPQRSHANHMAVSRGI